MTACQKNQPESTREVFGQADHRVRATPGKKSPCRLCLEPACQASERLQSTHPESARSQQLPRMERDTEGSCEVVDDDVPVANRWPDEVTVGVRVCSEPMRGLVEVAEEKHGAIIERVGERNRRLDPAKPVPIQGKLTEERRALAEWVDCTADVVNESGEREFGR